MTLKIRFWEKKKKGWYSPARLKNMIKLFFPWVTWKMCCSNLNRQKSFDMLITSSQAAIFGYQNNVASNSCFISGAIIYLIIFWTMVEVDTHFYHISI